jgi:hypothetical protein
LIAIGRGLALLSERAIVAAYEADPENRCSPRHSTRSTARSVPARSSAAPSLEELELLIEVVLGLDQEAA